MQLIRPSQRTEILKFGVKLGLDKPLIVEGSPGLERFQGGTISIMHIMHGPLQKYWKSYIYLLYTKDT